jgi:glycine cleavage system H protein
MPPFLELTVDKFTFRVATDRLYSPEGIWVQEENDHLRVGLSDFFQQRNGDVAFAEVAVEGSRLEAGDEFGVIETIKVDISLPSPVTGQIVAVNPALETAPEQINFDPYGDGWLALLLPADWTTAQAALLTPEAYYQRIKGEAEEEVSGP